MVCGAVAETDEIDLLDAPAYAGDPHPPTLPTYLPLLYHPI